jgi:stage II sporulation protein D
MQKRVFTPYFTLVFVIVVVIVIIPALLVLPFSEKKSVARDDVPIQEKSKEEMVLNSPVSVPIFREAESKVEEIDLEEYVKGVVASEMPADFELEALKAQALTARTYIVNLLLNPPDINLPGIAVASDTVQFQVYNSDQELKKIWGIDYEWKMEKITQAVYETQGQILTYEDQPISASFFSTSNGYTENSEDYWPNKLPYLRSVESPWDKKSPKFKHSKELSVQEVNRLLGVKINNSGKIGKVTEWTDGKRVGTIDIGGKDFTGREVRDLLGLSSSDFTMERKGDTVLIKSEGYGHGVGMSQYGADGMAKEGKTYEEIVKHYYQGVTISDSEEYVNKLSAAK